MMFRLAAWDRRRGTSRGAEDRRRRRRRLRPTLLALEERKLLSTIVVNNPTDTAVAGQVDLRQAIATANASGGSEAITFDGTVFATAQTIKLTNGPLDLSDATGAETITGPSAGLTISGGGLSGVFQVDSGVTASITGLTISGGQTTGDGGGVSNSGKLTLADCTVSGNTAGNGMGPADGGGIYNDGTLTVTDSTITANHANGNYFAGDGGGIFSSGTLMVTSSTITANFARGIGGGIRNSGGTATLTDTIVTDNTLSTFVGLLPNDTFGTVAGTYNLIGSGASGGLVNGVGGNQVGVSDPGLGALGNYGGPTETIPLLPGSPAIDAGTSAGAPVTDQRGESRVGAVDIGAFESQGFTLTPVAGSTPQTATIGAAFRPLTVTVRANNPVEPVDGGIVNFAATPANNGATAILMASSDVIAGGQAGVIGGPNNVDGSSTVRASGLGLAPATFDLTNAGPVFTRLVVNTTSSSLFAGAGLLSLPLAVDFANADTSGNANISFDPGVFGTPQTITLTGTQLELSNTGEAETITGPAAGVTISGGGLSRVFQVDNAVQARIQMATIVDGAALHGAAVDNLGTLDMSHCVLEHNAALHSGGGAAIDNESGATLTLTECTLTGNSTSGGGGSGAAILNLGTATLTDCSLSGNMAAAGAAILNTRGTLTMTGCQLDDNTALPLNVSSGGSGAAGPGIGGAVYNSNGTLTMANCTLAGNSANDGGAIFNGASYGASHLSLTDCILKGNVTEEYVAFWGTQQPNGGAIANQALARGVTAVSLTDCTLTGNIAGTTGGSGGAIASYCASSAGNSGQDTIALNDCILSGNATGGTGGAVNTSGGTLNMDGCILAGNSAGLAGGGAAINGAAALTGCTISGNTAGNGGGVDVYGTGQLSMSACGLSGNSATGEGGGLYVQGLIVTRGYYGTYTSGPASLALDGVTVSGNSAASGGGVYNAGTITVERIMVLDNSAAAGGGIDNVAGATATIGDAMIVANDSTGDGGGIANAGTLSMTDSAVVANIAAGDGGGIANSGTLSLADTLIVANAAAGDGGGLDNTGTAALVDCHALGNSAASGGGIYAAPQGTVKLTRTLVVGNRKDNIVGTVTYE